VRAIQRTQFRAKNVKNDLNPTDLVKRNFCCETEGVVNLIVGCPGRSLPLIFCIHVRSGPIYWGGYLPCKKDYKVMVFYM
jgi:hypothetical protein